MSALEGHGITVGIFASDKGPGDAERASLMTQTGSYFARRGARIVVLAQNGVIPVPLITAARAVRGHVQVVADNTIHMPQALSDVPVEELPDAAACHARLAELAQVFVALPGSLASATALFGAWAHARQTGTMRPVVMLNRHKAFEVMRGYAADVLSPGLPGHDRTLQFADTVEDLWTRASRLATDAR
jgi:predicted Rossmann-fold nucleotide-binding protein